MGDHFSDRDMFLFPQVIAVYTFLGVWATKEIKSMKFTFGIVVVIWSFMALLVVALMTVNHNQKFNVIASTSVSMAFLILC